MSLFFRKKKGEKEEVNEENKVTEEETKDTTNDDSETKETKLGDDGVPQDLKDKLAEIRGQEDPGYEEVEVKEDDDTSDEVKDGESINADGEVQDDEPSEDDLGTDGSESEDVNEQPKYIQIDPRLEEAGRAYGFSEEKIRTIAEADVSILADLADRLEKKNEGHREDKDEVKEDEVTITEADIEKLREKMGDEGVDVLLAMKKENESLQKRFSEVDELKQSNAVKAANEVMIREQNTASEIFDANAKIFEELGVTKDLKKYPDGKFVDCSELDKRKEIYQVAKKFQAHGGTFEAAMKDAMQWYAGAGKEEAIGRKLVKDINKNKKRFTVRPNRRKVKKVFKNANSKAQHIVREAYKKAGVK